MRSAPQHSRNATARRCHNAVTCAWGLSCICNSSWHLSIRCHRLQLHSVQHLRQAKRHFCSQSRHLIYTHLQSTSLVSYVFDLTWCLEPELTYLSALSYLSTYLPIRPVKAHCSAICQSSAELSSIAMAVRRWRYRSPANTCHRVCPQLALSYMHCAASHSAC